MPCVIMGYVPEFAYSVVAPDDMGFEGLGLYRFGSLEPKDKASPILGLSQDPSVVQSVVVEFHSDVDMHDARAIVLDLQMQIRRIPKPVIAMVAGWAIGGGHVLHVVCYRVCLCCYTGIGDFKHKPPITIILSMLQSR